MHKYPGKLIAVEGVNGVLKTEVIEAAKKYIDHEDLIWTGEPWTQDVKDLLKESKGGDDSKAIIYDRLQHIAGVIHPGLKDGKTIVTDRYYGSSIYQASTIEAAVDDFQAQQDRFIHPDLWIFFTARFYVILPRLRLRCGGSTEIGRRQTFQRQAKYGLLINEGSMYPVETIRTDKDGCELQSAHRLLRHIRQASTQSEELRDALTDAMRTIKDDIRDESLMAE